MRLSIIVPVYRKPQALLRRTLESILAQSETDFELIAVDDASPDDSGKVLAEYAARDPRVKVLTHEVNRGVSAARNTALEAATGDFIGFVDADDVIAVGFYSTLLRTADTYNCDMVTAENYRKLAPGENLPEAVFTMPEKPPRPRRIPAVTDRVIWNRIYRRAKLGQLRFATELSHCEDLVYINAAELKSAVTVSIDYPGYGYVNAHGSAPAPMPEDEAVRRIVRMMREYLQSLEMLTGLRDETADPEKKKLLSYLVLRRALRFCVKTRNCAPGLGDEIWALFRDSHAAKLYRCGEDYPCCGRLAGMLFRRNFSRRFSPLAANIIRMMLELSSMRILMARAARKRNLRRCGCDIVAAG